MSSKHLLTIIVCASLAGCQVRGSSDTELVTAEDNDAGITQIEIHHGLVSGERVLTIRGLDASEQEIAELTLRTGTVLYSFDPGLFPPAPNDGTELTARITSSMGDETFTNITPDRKPHQAVLPEHAGLVTFVRLHAVAAAVEEEAGIWFPAPRGTSGGEVAFTGGACSGSRFPAAKGNPSECCEDVIGGVTTTFHKIANVAANSGPPDVRNFLGTRTYGAACTMSGGGSYCGNPGGPYQTCNFGPCGGTGGGNSGNGNAAVFHPTGQTTQCGRDGDGTGTGAGSPENYTGSQTLWTGVTASCWYQSCCVNPNTGTGEPQTGTTCLGYENEACSTDASCLSGQCNSFSGTCEPDNCSTGPWCDSVTNPCCDGWCNSQGVCEGGGGGGGV